MTIPAENLVVDRTGETAAAIAPVVAVPAMTSATKNGLAALFFWMLWGDFCFTMLELTLPKLLPLTLQKLGASNTLIGVTVGSIAGVLNMIITPIVSFRSDRLRTPLGRRIPYLIWPTPFMALLLIMIGYAEPLGAWLHRHIGVAGSVSVSGFTIGLIVALVACFQCFNMVVSTVYYYLFADVVPQHLMGRFLALFRVVGAAAGFAFNWFLFSRFEVLGPRIYAWVAVLYMVSFMLMCWRVKEPTYPPPPSDPVQRRGLLASVETYFRESFSNPYYLLFYLGTASLTIAVGCAANFLVFFAQNSLGMSLADFGKLMGIISLVGLGLYLPMGYVTDRWQPVRVNLVATTLVVAAALASLLLIRGRVSFWVLTVAGNVAFIAYSASSLPMYVALLPKDRFGQMCSAQALVNAGGMIIGSALAGRLIDGIGSYRVVYVWTLALGAVSLTAMIGVYRGWVARGGENGYVPPPVRGAASP